MNKLKIIFLDFDGVITTPETRWNLDKSKIKLLEEIIETTEAKIVVSSSWGAGSRNREEFIKKTFSGHIKNKTTETSKDSLFIQSIIDVTDHMGISRGDEIERWLNLHENEVDSYVILDDDDDFQDKQLFHFVQTDTFEGLTTREVKLSIQILNKEKVINPIRLNYQLRYRWMKKCDNPKDDKISLLMNDYYFQFKN